MAETNKRLFFEWDSRYITGNSTIDSQHKQLFELGNQLFNADYTGGKKLISACLEKTFLG